MDTLSLNEYAGKYRVSISTLRRRIKSGGLSFHLVAGKYFLEDKSPEKLKPGKTPEKSFFPPVKDQDLQLKQSAKTLTSSSLPPPETKQKASFVSVPERDLLNKLLDAQQALYKQMEKKEDIINRQKDKIADLNTLTALLEKENRQLKSLLQEEKQIERWLERP